MVVIRLARVGKKQQPQYRVVVADSRRAAKGRFIDILGHYNPMTDPAEITLNREEIAAWIAKGAQPSDTVKSLIDHDEKNEPIKNKPKKPKAKKEAPVAEAPAEEEAEEAATASPEETPEETPAEEAAVEAESTEVNESEEAEAGEGPAETAEVTESSEGEES